MQMILLSSSRGERMPLKNRKYPFSPQNTERKKCLSRSEEKENKKKGKICTTITSDQLDKAAPPRGWICLLYISPQLHVPCHISTRQSPCIAGTRYHEQHVGPWSYCARRVLQVSRWLLSGRERLCRVGPGNSGFFIDIISMIYFHMHAKKKGEKKLR